MTLAALEARRGELVLKRYEGNYGRAPLLAAGFLLFGLASVGFPGTLGFIGEEALAHGAFATAPLRGALVLLASALNAITVMRFYFALFGGPFARETSGQEIRPRERLSVLALAAVLLAGGLFPRAFLESRERAARETLQNRPVSGSSTNRGTPRVGERFPTPRYGERAFPRR
jgi:NADH-quinone oxidoreductase subunit M